MQPKSFLKMALAVILIANFSINTALRPEKEKAHIEAIQKEIDHSTPMPSGTTKNIVIPYLMNNFTKTMNFLFIHPRLPMK